jgi:HlyD family secretion protein
VKRRIVILVVLAAVAGFVSWRIWQGRATDANRIVVHGNIELTEVDLAFKMPGRVAELLVDEGDAVRKGQVVARLDRAELERTRDREQATERMAQSALVQLRTGIDYQREAISGEVELRLAEVRQAEARLAELESGSRKQEIQQAWAAEQEARTQYETAQRDWERAQRLYQNEDISTAQHDQYRMRAEATAMTYQRARETLALVKEGPRTEQIAAARAALERARAGVRLAEAARIDLRRREEELSARAADIDRARAQLAVLDTQLDDRVMVSPTDGVVLTKAAEAGEVLAAGAVVVTLGDIDRPWVRAYIMERDLGRVKLGMPVDVRTDSYPNKVYRGTVSMISSRAEFTPKTIQTEEERVKLVYRIKIEVENPGRELKLNMPVDAEIRLP